MTAQQFGRWFVRGLQGLGQMLEEYSDEEDIDDTTLNNLRHWIERLRAVEQAQACRPSPARPAPRRTTATGGG